MNSPEPERHSLRSARFTVGACLSSASGKLAHLGSGRIDAEVLLGHVLGWTKTELHTRITDPVGEAHQLVFRDLVEQRRDGIPVAYLVGWKDFYSRRFWVRPGVLVPRPETEMLVDEALALLQRSPGATRILDLCCGTGCIGITLALETLTGQVVASDVDPVALKQTQENISFFGVEQRIRVVASDLFDALDPTPYDLIVTNPPYVGTKLGPRPEERVAMHEPNGALFSGQDGTDHLKAIVERAPAYLIEGGSLVLECACFQAEKIEAWMTDRGFAQTRLWHDLTGLPRGVSGRWEGKSL